MKKCLKCLAEKLDTEFGWRNKNKNLRKPYCLGCNRLYDKQKYEATKLTRLPYKKISAAKFRHKIHELLAKYLLEHPCVDCGKTDIRFLEFDHIKEKNKNISDMIGNNSISKILSEIELCEVRCIECHRLKTHKGVNAIRLKMWEKYQKSI